MQELSWQQATILRILYECYQKQAPRTRDIDGVEWGPGLSRVRAASVSRSLRRLEERGLIERWTTGVGSRTTHVHLRPAGIALAQRLTHAPDDGC